MHCHDLEIMSNPSWVELGVSNLLLSESFLNQMHVSREHKISPIKVICYTKKSLIDFPNFLILVSILPEVFTCKILSKCYGWILRY